MKFMAQKSLRKKISASLEAVTCAASAAASNLGTGASIGINVVRDWIVPPTCLMCDAIVVQPGGCCSKCWGTIRFVARPYCEVLGSPFSYDMGQGAVCADAIANPPPFNRARAAVLYDDPIRRLISGLKYSDRLDVAPWIAKWMARAGRQLIEENPIVIPVPLYKTRLLTRRFNQSAEIARTICKDKNLEYRPQALKRIRKTKQQVGLSRQERAKNVSGVFIVPPEYGAELKGKSILLIDDVLTTGATVSSAAKALNRVGVASVDVLTFARVESFDM